MQAFKNAVADLQLRYRISKVVSTATSTHKLDLKHEEVDEVVALIDQHAHYVLNCIRDRLSGSNPSVTYLAILLLEHCVNASNFNFHVLVANDAELQKQLVRLAADRAENDTARKVRSAARKVVLDFSRMFADEAKLYPLSTLAEQVEKITGKRLMRSIILESRRVEIKLPEAKDIVMYHPQGPEPQSLENQGGSAGTMWICTGCNFRNVQGCKTCPICGLHKGDVSPFSTPESSLQHLAKVEEEGTDSPKAEGRKLQSQEADEEKGGTMKTQYTEETMTVFTTAIYQEVEVGTDSPNGKEEGGELREEEQNGKKKAPPTVWRNEKCQKKEGDEEGSEEKQNRKEEEGKNGVEEEAVVARRENGNGRRQLEESEKIVEEENR